MHEGQALAEALATISSQSLIGTAYRIIPAQYHVTALSTIGAFQMGGRYNPAGKLEALYPTEDPITALQEVEMIRLTSTGLMTLTSNPKTLLSITYTLHALLDLTNPAVSAHLGTTLEELIAPYLPLEARLSIAPTQALGLTAAASGLEALKVPSAKNPRVSNLVIYPQNLKPGSTLRVVDDSGFIDAKLP